MVCHVCVDNRAPLALFYALRRVIKRLVKTVTRQRTITLQCAQILDCLRRLNIRSEQRRVRRDNEVFDQASLQAEPGYAEWSVLIIHLQIARSVSRLRNPPWHAPFTTI